VTPGVIADASAVDAPAGALAATHAVFSNKWNCLLQAWGSRRLPSVISLSSGACTVCGVHSPPKGHLCRVASSGGASWRGPCSHAGVRCAKKSCMCEDELICVGFVWLIVVCASAGTEKKQQTHTPTTQVTQPSPNAPRLPHSHASGSKRSPRLHPNIAFQPLDHRSPPPLPS
jgi:hypothetical protein